MAQALSPRENIIVRIHSYWTLIEKAAAKHGLDASLLAGLVAHESMGDTWAERLEPKYKHLWGDDLWERPIHKPAIMDIEHWKAAQKWSRGLCQVMVATACEHGFSGWPSQLHDPWTGLDWGAFYLKKCINRESGDVWRGLRRYNGSEDYPPLVLAWAKEFTAQEWSKKDD